MKNAPAYANEEGRLDALKDSKIITGQVNPIFDEFATRAAEKLHVAISTISAIDRDKEVYIGSCGLDAKEGPRDISFCGHALVSEEMLICKDTTKDERFADNPYVIGPPYIKFYAGIKLINWKSGEPIAVFCVKDTAAHNFSPAEIATFLELGEEAEKLINA